MTWFPGKVGSVPPERERRVAFVLTQSEGGPVDITVALVRWFAQRPGWTVRAFGPLPARGANDVVDYWTACEVPSKFDVAAIRWVAARVREFDPHVVHGQDRRAGLVCVWIKSGRQCELRAARGTSQGVFPYVVHTYHGVPDDVSQSWLVSGAGASPSRATLLTLLADSVVARMVDRTVVVSLMMGRFLKLRLHAPADRVVHIDNGLWLARKTRPVVGERCTRAVFVGALISRKGVADLLDAMVLVRDNVPEATLAVIGDGSLRDNLLDRRCLLGLDEAVEFLGFRSDIPMLMERYGVFVLPSHMEQQPLVLIEALSAGLLIVATDVGGVTEMLDSPGAWVVPAKDSVALADAIIHAMRCSDAETLSAANVERARRRFSVESCGTAHERLYSDLMLCSDRLGPR